jgi:type I restriction enzyme, S subunit
MDRPWIPAGLKLMRITADDLPALLVQRVARLRGTSSLDTGFLYCLLRHPHFTFYILGVQTGTTIPHISARQILGYEFKLPPLAQQRRIAAVLGALDDKIALNRRMNRTLEETAQALFRRRFVEFDGRDDLVDSGTDLGQIPPGWQVGPLSQLAVVQTGMIQPGDQPKRVWEHYSIPAYDDGERPANDVGSTIKSGKYRVPPSAVLLSKLNPRFPRVWLPDVDEPGAAICSTEFIPLVPRRAEWRPFLYGMLWSEPVQDTLRSSATGSTTSRQRVTPRAVAAFEVVVPPAAEIERYSVEVGPLLNRRLANLRQSRTLAALRDALLPKLISGELRVPEAEAHISEVA